MSIPTIPQVLRNSEPHPELGIGRQVWPYPHRCGYDEYNAIDLLVDLTNIRPGMAYPSSNGIKPTNFTGASDSFSSIRLCFPVDTRIRNGQCGIVHDQFGNMHPDGWLMNGARNEARGAWTIQSGNGAIEMFPNTVAPARYPATDQDGRDWWNTFFHAGQAKYGCVCFLGGKPTIEPVWRESHGDYFLDYGLACAYSAPAIQAPTFTPTFLDYNGAPSVWPNLDWETSGLVFDQENVRPPLSSSPETIKFWGFDSVSPNNSIISEVVTHCDGTIGPGDPLSTEYYMGCACNNNNNAYYNTARILYSGNHMDRAYAVADGRDFSMITTGIFSIVHPVRAHAGFPVNAIIGWNVFAPVCRTFASTLPIVKLSDEGSSNTPFAVATDAELFDSRYSTPSGAAINQLSTNRVCGLGNLTSEKSDRYWEAGCECNAGWYDNGYGSDYLGVPATFPSAGRMTRLGKTIPPDDMFYDILGLQSTYAFGQALPVNARGCSSDPGIVPIGISGFSWTVQPPTATYLCERTFLPGSRPRYTCGTTTALAGLTPDQCISARVTLLTGWRQCQLVDTSVTNSVTGTITIPRSCSWRFPLTCSHPHCSTTEDAYTESSARAITSGTPGDGTSPRNKYTCFVQSGLSANHVWLSTVQQGPQIARSGSGLVDCVINTRTMANVIVTITPNVVAFFPSSDAYCSAAGSLSLSGCVSPALTFEDMPPSLPMYWDRLEPVDTWPAPETALWSNWLGPFPALEQFAPQPFIPDAPYTVLVSSQFCQCIAPTYYIGQGWRVEDPNRALGVSDYRETYGPSEDWVAKFAEDMLGTPLCIPTIGYQPTSPARDNTPCSPSIELQYYTISADTQRKPGELFSCACGQSGSEFTAFPVNVPLDEPYTAPNFTFFKFGQQFTDYVDDTITVPFLTPETPQDEVSFVRNTSLSLTSNNCRGNSCEHLERCNMFEVTTRPFWPLDGIVNGRTWDEAAFDECIASGLGSKEACTEFWHDNGITLNECVYAGINDGGPEATCKCDHGGVNEDAGTPFGLWFDELMNCAACDVQGGVCFMPEVPGTDGTKCWTRYDDYENSIWAGTSPFCDCVDNAPNTNALGPDGCTARGGCMWEFDQTNTTGTLENEVASGRMFCTCDPFDDVDGLDSDQGCRGCKEGYGPQWTDDAGFIDIMCTLPTGYGTIEGAGSPTQRYNNIRKTSCGGFVQSETTDSPPYHICVCLVTDINMYPPTSTSAQAENMPSGSYETIDLLGQTAQIGPATDPLEPDFGSPIALQVGWVIPPSELTCSGPLCPGFCNGPEAGDSSGHICHPGITNSSGLESHCECADSRGHYPNQATYNAHFLPLWFNETQRWQSACMPDLCQPGWEGEYCDIIVCSKDIFTPEVQSDIICGSNATRVINGIELPRYDEIGSNGVAFGCIIDPFDDTGQPITTDYVGQCTCVNGIRGYLGCQFSMGRWPSVTNPVIDGDCVDPEAPDYLASALCYGRGTCTRKNTAVTEYDALTLTWTNDEGWECLDCSDPYTGSQYCGDNLCALKFGSSDPTRDPCAPFGHCETNGDPDPNNAVCVCNLAHFGDQCNVDATPWCVGPGANDPVCSGRGVCTPTGASSTTAAPSVQPTLIGTQLETDGPTATEPETVGSTVRQTESNPTEVPTGLDTARSTVFPFECVCDPNEGTGLWCQFQTCEGGTVDDCAFGACIADTCQCAVPSPTSIWINNPDDGNRCNLAACVPGQGAATDPNSAESTCTCEDGFFGDFCELIDCPYDTSNPPAKCGDEGPVACDGNTGECVCSLTYTLQPNPLLPQVCVDTCDRENNNEWIGEPPANCFCKSDPGVLDRRTTRPDMLGLGCYVTFCNRDNGYWNDLLQLCVCDDGWEMPPDYPYPATYYRCDEFMCEDPELPVFEPLPAPGFCVDPNADPVTTWPCAGRGIVTSAPGDPITCDCFIPFTDGTGCIGNACQYDTSPLVQTPPIIKDGVCDCSTSDLGLDGVFCENLFCIEDQGQWDQDLEICKCFNQWIGLSCEIDGCYPPTGFFDADIGECRCTANTAVRWEPGSSIPDECALECPPNSYFNPVFGVCVCNPFYVYEPSSGGICDLFCVNGTPITDECVCDDGWTSPENGCIDFDCGPNGVHDPREPTDDRCICNQFWNGPLCDVYCAPEVLWQYSEISGVCECQLPDPPGCGPVPTGPPSTARPTQGPIVTPTPTDGDNLALILGLSIGLGIPVLLALILIPLFFVPSSPLYKGNKTATTAVAASGRYHKAGTSGDRYIHEETYYDDETGSDGYSSFSDGVVTVQR